MGRLCRGRLWLNSCVKSSDEMSEKMRGGGGVLKSAEKEWVRCD